MWLDAFKPKSQTLQNMGVSGVTGVSQTANLGPMRVSGRKASLTPQKPGGVRRVNQSENSNTTDTVGRHDKNRCQLGEIDRNPSNHAGYSGSLTPLTPLTPQKHDAPENSDVALFRLDLFEQDVAAGYQAAELRRVNNIAWHLITARGFQFHEAMSAAAAWVIVNPAHRDEAAFVDVME